MALESFVDSNFQLAAHSLALTWPTGGFLGSSSSDNLLQKDEHYQAVVPSLLNSSSGNLPNGTSVNAHMNVGRALGEIDPSILNHTGKELSVRPSSLDTDSKSALSKGPLHRSASANMDSYPVLRTSPALFSSHNSCSSSSVVSGSSITQHTSRLNPKGLQVHKRKHQQGEFAAASQEATEVHKNSFINCIKQEPCTSTQMHKKSRLGIQQEAIMQQHIIQQLLQNPDSAQLQEYLPQLQELFQHHQLRKQKQQNSLHPIPQYQGVGIQQQLQQHISQHLQQQVLPQVPAMRSFNEGICSRRLMQLIYHLRQRPADNGIAYWRKFIREYYAPCARRRWCLSSYDKVGRHAFGMIPLAATDAWQCEICGCKSGKGFEAIFEVLPRLYKITFDNVMDELLFLDLPHERRFPSGLMMLEYGKAVQESVYEQLRVVREGHLRIIYTHDLKILSWEFCSGPHEELLPRTLLAPKVDKMVHAALKYESTNSSSESVVVSPEDLQANSDAFQAAGCQVARTLDLQLVDDLGFSRRYSRCMQIAEVVSCMKDLMTFSFNNNTGPMESLKNYSQETTTSKIGKEELHEKEVVGSAQCLPTDDNKLMAGSSGHCNNVNGCVVMTNGGLLTSSEEAALMPPGSYHKLLRQNNSTSEQGRVKRQGASLRVSNQDVSFESNKGSKASSPGLIQHSPMDGLSSSHSIEGSQNIRDKAIQKILQEMVNNSRKLNVNAGDTVIREEGKSHVVDVPARGKGMNVHNGLGSRYSTTALDIPGNVLRSAAGRISSSGAVFNREVFEFCGNNSSMKKKETDVPEKLQLPEALIKMINGYHENGKLSGNSEDMCNAWRN
ncbi:probable transcriptional regulator SLK3 [Juglans microcarpa x Juglans regia]|uniref:probable transcriptional regulator SLK3 n=1 Tax=Juglans microcarpa x Juglans regia TaxID=2249226 RepID=UPI001B7DDD8C|nr:probable transcriptional regulator SLK3 [Juglans microcarpa x Juglans regia]XP_040988486.1 probable transcriptional regulator SLK3 [Juglans microcarpa x Juglans regia]XP_040988487.1 probable transcriptional regulator SLK3 [Juglans microcarpa x Juglans regia]